MDLLMLTLSFSNNSGYKTPKNEHHNIEGQKNQRGLFYANA